MALPAYLTLTGERQGVIKGSCNQKGREGTILVQAVEHEVTIPRDPQTGLATGKRIHHPLTILKAVDRSSPLLYMALTSGEHMKTVEINWYLINEKGQEENYFITKLDDAIIVSIKTWKKNCLDPAFGHLGDMEEVSFTYRKIMWRSIKDGVESEDDWSSPK
jgi:type VI secretion system secreted protein Hcp